MFKSVRHTAYTAWTVNIPNGYEATKLIIIVPITGSHICQYLPLFHTVGCFQNRSYYLNWGCEQLSAWNNEYICERKCRVIFIDLIVKYLVYLHMHLLYKYKNMQRIVQMLPQMQQECHVIEWKLPFLSVDSFGVLASRVYRSSQIHIYRMHTY